MHEPQEAQSIEHLTLGQRLVLAAHLAVARHLGQQQQQQQQQRGRRQQVAIGGAGPVWVTDDPTTTPSELSDARAAESDPLRARANPL
jgi:hypothetical protein